MIRSECIFDDSFILVLLNYVNAFYSQCEFRFFL
jgi:hypothetical protein